MRNLLYGRVVTINNSHDSDVCCVTDVIMSAFNVVIDPNTGEEDERIPTCFYYLKYICKYIGCWLYPYISYVRERVVGRLQRSISKAA